MSQSLDHLKTIDGEKLLEKMHEFMETCQPGNMFEVGVYQNVVSFHENRDETDEELRKRIISNIERKMKIQKKADNSWKRQQRKFAKARKK